MKNCIIGTIEKYLFSTNKADASTLKQLNELFSNLKGLECGLITSLKTSYDDIQRYLQSANEKQSARKKRGVYYTPKDVVDFIVTTALKLDLSHIHGHTLTNTLDSVKTQETLDFCFTKTFLEPTCGTGEFLLSVLDIKIKLLSAIRAVTSDDLEKILRTLYGNDINPESAAIAKLRIWLYIKHYFYTSSPANIIDILNSNFKEYDFVDPNSILKNEKCQYDYTLGNPPYVEDSKSGLKFSKKYGNIYANILINSLMLLKENGVMGFIIPISFVSTPRMKKLRDDLLKHIDKSFILSYSDRPDCLFAGVHQKLCVVIGRKKENTTNRTIYTSNYQYWYKSERERLFSAIDIIANPFNNQGFIPKLGTSNDQKIYKKILQNSDNLLNYLTAKSKTDSFSVSLNMRATFWIKAFLSPHLDGEYKQFNFVKPELAAFAMCLLNSSLFWWFWVVVSDCWHITRKELENFYIPKISQDNLDLFSVLAKKLEDKLEKTKQYVGTKQVDYEYKHRLCLEEIHQIDDAIGRLYGLELSEMSYIKNFALQYRLGIDVAKSN